MSGVVGSVGSTLKPVSVTPILAMGEGGIYRLWIDVCALSPKFADMSLI